jgi:type VI secretion system secreted protein Hcp
MSQFHFLKTSIFTTFLILSNLIAVPLVHAAGYLKIGDIKGESTRASHKDWIPIETVLDLAAIPDNEKSGAARTRGDVVLSDIQVTKALDRSSPLLREAITQNRVFPTATIEFLHDDGRAAYYRMELTNVSVSRVETTIADSASVEVIELSYEAISWRYSGQNGDTEASWNQSTGRMQIAPQINRLISPQ